MGAPSGERASQARTSKLEEKVMDYSAQVKTDPRRALPSVERIVRELAAEDPELPVWALQAAAREVLNAARERFASAEGASEARIPSPAELTARIAARAAKLAAGHPQRVVNATGIPLHTNLGRAPLAPGAAAAVAEAAAGYSDLELDLATGRRGDRLAALAAKLTLQSGAEAALAVNNNAAALLLALDTFARGREVIVSRGELVEIGGSFRVPEIMERAGVKLVEVGSTNRTHAGDYERAIGPETALLLKVHRSNFEQTGFVAEVGLAELAEVAARHALPVLEDLGSGTLVDLSRRGLPAEAFAPARLRLGADVVCFSGDKLLGGPQAGIVLGAEGPLTRMRRNPLARALRLDKLSLAALDWTLGCYLDGRAEREIPVLKQLLATGPALEARARALASRLAKVVGESGRVEVSPDRAFVGGGSLPGFELDTWVVAIRSSVSAESVSERLRVATPAVLARVRDDLVIFDVRTLLDGEEAAVEAAVNGIFAVASE
jgi:L-seryl-tRNA(Ser) seleniumtransferase